MFETSTLSNPYVSFKVDGQRPVWLSHISLMATQSLQLYRRRQPFPLLNPSNSLVHWSKLWDSDLEQGTQPGLKQPTNQGKWKKKKQQLRRSMERGVARQLGESFSFLWQEFIVVGSTYLTTALHAIPDILKGHRCNTQPNRRGPNLHSSLKYQN